MMAGEFKQFIGLLILGNIENLIIASLGVTKGLNPIVLSLLSLCFVVAWYAIGTFGTRFAIKYANYITFIGGLAIFILGVKSMWESVPGMIEIIYA